PIASSVFLPTIRSERAAAPEELAKVLGNITPPLPYSIAPSINEALTLARAKPNLILITGSLHFAGEVIAHLRGEPAPVEECAQEVRRELSGALFLGSAGKIASVCCHAELWFVMLGA